MIRALSGCMSWHISATIPLAWNNTIFVNNVTNTTSLVDVSVINPDTGKVENGTGALDGDKWMNLPVGKDGKPYSVIVQPRKKCYQWKIERLSFEVRGASRFRVRIGDTFITDWVSYFFSGRCLLVFPFSFHRQNVNNCLVRVVTYVALDCCPAHWKLRTKWRVWWRSSWADVPAKTQQNGRHQKTGSRRFLL